jgi:bacterioferritin
MLWSNAAIEVPMKELNKDKAIALLNRILEHELAGVVRYTHYSPVAVQPNTFVLIFGHR